MRFVSEAMDLVFSHTSDSMTNDCGDQKEIKETSMFSQRNINSVTCVLVILHCFCFFSFSNLYHLKSPSQKSSKNPSVNQESSSNCLRPLRDGAGGRNTSGSGLKKMYLDWSNTFFKPFVHKHTYF